MILVILFTGGDRLYAGIGVGVAISCAIIIMAWTILCTVRRFNRPISRTIMAVVNQGDHRPAADGSEMWSQELKDIRRF